jgi:serine protease Do
MWLRHLLRALIPFLLLAMGGPGRADDQAEAEAASQALTKAMRSTVAITARAVEGANSTATLGRDRQGSGIVIDDRGRVLTIGYLILEADEVELRTHEGRRFPARVLAYDVATGFGLLQPLVPTGLAPVPLGEPRALDGESPLLVASGGPDGGWSPARLLARKAFAGYWEYHIEGALFTTPPRRDHSGAGLFNLRGELVGVGSLILADAGGAPGNMFVPVDLLKPILAELLERGRSRASERAWLGLNCVDQPGGVQVLRVSTDSPAALAGVRPGDRILRIDGSEVGDLAALWKRLWAGPGVEREVTLDVQREGTERRLVLKSVDRASTLRKPMGV